MDGGSPELGAGGGRTGLRSIGRVAGGSPEPAPDEGADIAREGLDQANRRPRPESDRNAGLEPKWLRKTPRLPQQGIAVAIRVEGGYKVSHSTRPLPAMRAAGG